MAYSDYSGAKTHRKVNPLGLAYMDQSTVLLAWCHLRRDFRVFRLDRMRDLEMTEDSFRPDRVPMLRAARAHIQREVEELAKRRTSED